ncbi:3-hydroxybutyrate dehydrogenase [Temperatibacter marinus]|uniref:3-hydroxybutyrate dehydrogenase n=1 Tax=Temperatibacter marinus TaxID=1456591 RepID=A0AA52H972_9PROT|nr:3-hydroxybutyrate dehydrogenase [Temperatibacter marinus]WND02589.1 3-hydroxybutyrate dehydrogenase [Temperatibacter marinus]
MTDLTGKIALITGSTSGIGLGIAEHFAKAGATIAVNGFGTAEEITYVVENLSAYKGNQARFFPADLMDGEAAITLVNQVVNHFGKIDVLINNAGIQHVEKVEDFPADRWESIISLNLSSAFYTSKAAVPHMRRSGYGRILNIASAHGLVASPFKSAYVAAKHGVVGFTKSLGLELAEEENICVNAICPGYVRTPLVDMQIKDQAKVHNMTEEEVIREVILAAQPNKRFVTVEEVADLALYLCKDATRSFNGAALPIEGGWTAR